VRLRARTRALRHQLTDAGLPGGRWVVDDYYEDKVLAEITEKGLSPGDPVGDLVDPAAHASAADQAAIAQAGGKQEPRGSGLGMYRAGGPTTIFGGAGWGPYSDGPLNAVRKSLLSRDGVNEENWMLVAAQRTADASAEWAKQRRARLRPAGGLLPLLEKREAEEGAEPDATRRPEEDAMPLGLYEPHANIVLCEFAPSSSVRSR
jgi:chromatin structure-remodeling complex protein RSC7